MTPCGFTIAEPHGVMSLLEALEHILTHNKVRTSINKDCSYFHLNVKGLELIPAVMDLVRATIPMKYPGIGSL